MQTEFLGFLQEEGLLRGNSGLKVDQSACCSPDMNMHRLLFVTTCAVVAVISTSAADSGGDVVPVIKTGAASIRGKRLHIDPYLLPDYHASVAAYTRIPYAEPPVGDRRFRRPVPKVLEGNVDATRAPVACSQASFPMFDIGLEVMEDCLYLDVYVPESTPRNAAVMVWIHGGGFTVGAASIPSMVPTPLVAMTDVIVVGINYRLNIFGFLGTGDEEMPFNLGMLDQVQALRWVQDNIAAFGGDPSRVTIFGVSAGSMSVSFHVFSPLSAGLFSRGIMQSGVAKTDFAWRTHEKGAEMAFRFGQVMNCSDDVTVTELVECLRKIPAEDITSYFDNNVMASFEFPLGPAIDGQFLPKDPNEMSANGETNDVAIMVGCLENEGSLFLFNPADPEADGMSGLPVLNKTTALPSITMFAQGVDELGFEVLSLVYLPAEELEKPDPVYTTAVVDFNGDNFFLCSTFSMSKELAKAGMSVYTYLMTHVPSESIWGKAITWAGATHGEDIAYVFGSPYLLDQPSPDGDSKMTGCFNEEEIEISRQIMAYWANFAKTGDPNLSALDGASDPKYPAWPKFSVETGSYKDLSRSFENLDGHPQPKRCYFLEDVLPKLKANAAEMNRLKALLEEKVNADSGKACEDPASCPEE